MYNVILESKIVSASYMAEGGPMTIGEAVQVARDVHFESPGQFHVRIVEAA